jgi:hypothetical protein
VVCAQGRFFRFFLEWRRPVTENVDYNVIIVGEKGYGRIKLIGEEMEEIERKYKRIKYDY